MNILNASHKKRAMSDLSAAQWQADGLLEARSEVEQCRIAKGLRDQRNPKGQAAFAKAGGDGDCREIQQVYEVGIEAEIGADIDEDIRLDLGAALHEVFQLRIFADLCGNFEPADIDGTHQKVGAEIAADEITRRRNLFRHLNAALITRDS